MYSGDISRVPQGTNAEVGEERKLKKRVFLLLMKR
jgi:hypothetical protein